MKHTRRRRIRYTKRELLTDALIAVIWFGFWFYVACRFFYVIAAPAPAEYRIRDGVHAPVFTALTTIDRHELADMRAAEDWTEPETVSSRFTDHERDLLARVMMCEAGNQGPIGAALVGRVILNRVESGRFPNSVEAVIYQPGQFSTASYLYRYEPNADCYAALELLEAGWDESQGALYFCTTSFSWATYLFSFGNHNFFA